jgi:predicted ATPase with chaperone activity
MSGDILSRLAQKQAGPDQAAVEKRPYVLACEQPPEPKEVADLGIPEAFVEDMILKTLTMRGAMTEHQLSWHLKLPKNIVANMCKDLTKRKLIGPPASNPMAFVCGSEGKARAEDANNTTRYIGPVPVTVDEYVTRMRQQVGRPLQFSQEDIESAYSRIVMYDKEFRDRIGPAVRSQRSILLYGAPGNGKTIMGKCLTALMKSDLLIPYAIYAHGQVLKLFDSSVHKPIVPDEYKEFEIGSTDDVRYDPRWVVINVPYVEVATEFTLEGFELNYNSYAKYYEMPAHVKANGGVFFIDDFGRQKGKAEDYLNRLITPLQSREDILSLSATGGQIRVPFYCIPLFSTNFTLDKIGDEAFLRRFKYKILAKSPDEEALEEIFKFECMRSGVDYVPEIYRHFLTRLKRRGAKLRSCLANDILSKIIDYSTFHGIKPEMNQEMVDLAFDLNFSEQTETWDFGTKEDKK